MKSVSKGHILIAACLVCGAIVLTASDAAAQCPGQAQVIQLNRQGMQAYENLDVDVALSSLRQATQIAAPCISNSVRARTLLNLGVVHVGGFMNNAEGLDAFRRALCFDSAVMLDPLTSTPDIQTAFRLAASQNQQQGCPGGMPTPTPTPTPVPTPGPGPGPGQPGGFELSRHSPVQEQVRMHPVPLYVEVNPAVQAGRVVAQYRVAGETQYTSLPMESLGQNAYAGTIPCGTITLFDPSWIEYYIEIFRPDGGQVGVIPPEGRERPHRTNMVQTLSGPPPAIPGRGPERRCVNCDDLPPGAQRDECRRTSGGGGGGGGGGCESGFRCDVDDDCPGDGMSCSAGCCGGGSGGGGGGDGRWRPHAYIQIGAGWGGGYVAATEGDDGTGEIPGHALLRNTDSSDECEDNDQGGPIENETWATTGCWHRTADSGFGYGPGHMRIYAGGYILPQLSAGLYFRYQFDGFSSDAHYLWAIGVRARYHIIQTENIELSVGLMFQIYGMEQVYLNLANSSGENVGKAWRTGGYEAIGVMVGFAYYFARQYFGVFVELTSDWTMGDFIWNVEMTAGPTLRF